MKDWCPLTRTEISLSRIITVRIPYLAAALRPHEAVSPTLLPVCGASARVALTEVVVCANARHGALAAIHSEVVVGAAAF